MVPHTHGCFQSSHVSVKNKCKVGSWAVPSGVLIQGGRVGCVLSGQVMLSEFPDLHRVRKIGVPAVLHCTDMHFCACCLQELCHMEMECSELRVTRSYSQLQLCYCEATGQVCHSLDSSKVCVCSYIENRCIAQAEGCSFFFPFFLFFFFQPSQSKDTTCREEQCLCSITSSLLQQILAMCQAFQFQRAEKEQAGPDDRAD